MTQQLIPIYNIIVHEKKIDVVLNVTKTLDAIIRHQHVTRANSCLIIEGVQKGVKSKKLNSPGSWIRDSL